jgi:Domain of unknown function (DUF6894)
MPLMLLSFYMTIDFDPRIGHRSAIRLNDSRSPRLDIPAGRRRSVPWHRNCTICGMPLFYFRLVDSNFVADYGAHDLSDETVAEIEAIRLAKSLRDTRPQLLGKHYSISVTDGYGAGVCVVPLDADS